MSFLRSAGRTVYCAWTASHGTAAALKPHFSVVFCQSFQLRQFSVMPVLTKPRAERLTMSRALSEAAPKTASSPEPTTTPAEPKGAPSKEPTFKKPTIEMAKAMPRAYSEMSNESLLVFSAQEDFGANRERLIREIMAVDNVSWDGAQPRLEEMERANKERMFWGTLPYKVGFVGSVTLAVASIPLCFHLNTVLWFNEHYVTADVAEPKDLETWLEVGSWAWSWMEPPLGQFSFFLLCFAFARNQLINLGKKPYTDWLKNYRAERLQKRYPQYDPIIVADFAVHDDWE